MLPEGRAISIDSYCAESDITTVAVIKVDIQGAEPVAVAGAWRTIAANEDLILSTEMSSRHLASRGGTKAYLQTLVSAGFDLWRLAGERDTSSSVAELEHLTLGPATDHADLVCTKGSGARSRLEEAMTSLGIRAVGDSA